MSKVWYGNLTNRLEENKNFTGREIKPGDDITMYLYSDRHCYYVTDVIDQKHIKVKPYFVCADKSKEGGMGHQNWIYFKDHRAFCDYINASPDLTDEDHANAEREQTWVYRYNKWMSEYTVYGGVLENPEIYSERERKSFEKNGYLKTYGNLSGSVSFGRRDYHHDWEF